MKNYYIDTNCLVSYLTDRNIDQQQRITPYIENAALQTLNIILTQHVITECVFVLSSVYKIPDIHVAHMLNAMVQTPGLHIDEQFGLFEVISVWPNSFKNYGDAVLAASARKKKGVILTFDQHFYKECIKENLSVELP